MISLSIGAKDRMIVRQTCIKVAAEILSSFNVESATDEAVNADYMVTLTTQMAGKLESWVYRDVEGDRTES